MIAIIVALGFIIALLSHLYPHIRESKKRERFREIYEADYASSARKFAPPLTSNTLDYSSAEKDPTTINKGKSKLIEDSHDPRHLHIQHYHGQMWLPQSTDGEPRVL